MIVGAISSVFMKKACCLKDKKGQDNRLSMCHLSEFACVYVCVHVGWGRGGVEVHPLNHYELQRLSPSLKNGHPALRLLKHK